MVSVVTSRPCIVSGAFAKIKPSKSAFMRGMGRPRSEFTANVGMKLVLRSRADAKSSRAMRLEQTAFPVWSNELMRADRTDPRSIVDAIPALIMPMEMALAPVESK